MENPIRARLVAAFAVALGLLLAASARAQEVVPVGEVAFSRVIELVGNAVADPAKLSAQIRVTVVETLSVTEVSVRFPDVDTSQPLTQQSEPGVWLLDISNLQSAQDVIDAFPGGAYVFELVSQSGEEAPITVTVSVNYADPAIPDSPAISSPVHESQANPPSSTTFTFSSCGASCGATDSTDVTLRKGDQVVESGTLGSSATSWDNAPSPLEANAQLTFEVAHKVDRSTLLVDPLPFTFVRRFTHSDRVDFSTGALLCTGSFGLAIDDPQNPIYDPSGCFFTTAGGMDLEYCFTVDPRGKILGTGEGGIDIDGDEVRETPLLFKGKPAVKGKLRGKHNNLRQKTRIKIRSEAPSTEAKLKVRLKERLDTVTGLRTDEQKISGKRLGQKVSETTTDSVPIDDGARFDWALAFETSTVDGQTIDISGAELTYATYDFGDERIIDTAVALVGKGSFSVKRAEASLRFKSERPNKGIVIRIDELRTDEECNITGGVLRYKALGQKGRLQLPPRTASDG